MEPVVLNRDRAAMDRLKRMPMLFDDYREEDFYGLPRKYSIVARVEVKFPKEPRFRDRQHFIFSDINIASSLRIIPQYTSIRSITTPIILDVTIQQALVALNNRQFAVTFLEEQRRR
ncbi:hypothetical protein ZEAMMB73_Zm00001d017038 [Zea mays]|uniref:Uncharacterized protein n=1 Tax=Zea mays TaxID=4577 RepID=A0A1D6HBU9_MAIZE|nr:hypothetical protein ZEAMMB73_Zm00001d017038 [Zea mays]AQK72178.1 hypothetical protein ZEAMMB73_Zm00001d017038 [Zea mays]AQK72179.1 hypothetical protein ZEAMMB73_Zm00001d017038 [Zea mays]